MHSTVNINKSCFGECKLSQSRTLKKGVNERKGQHRQKKLRAFMHAFYFTKSIKCLHFNYSVLEEKDSSPVL